MQEKPSSELKLEPEPVPGAAQEGEAVKLVSDPAAVAAKATADAEKFNLSKFKPSAVTAKAAEAEPIKKEVELSSEAAKLQGILAGLLRRKEMVGEKFKIVQAKLSGMPSDVVDKLTQGARDRALAAETKKIDNLNKLREVISKGVVVLREAGSLAAVVAVIDGFTGAGLFGDNGFNIVLSGMLAWGLLPTGQLEGMNNVGGLQNIENNFKSI